MADNILKGKIQIEAASGVRQNLEILTNQLTRLQRIAASGDLGFKQFERVNGLIAKTQAQINSFSKTAASSFTNVAQGSNSATQSLINLSRVAQDAPFGFIGIANNLNPLLESFQRLRVEAGSNKAALTALTSSLAGPAGLGLALGVVSSLLITFGGDLFSSSKESDKLADSLRKVGDAADVAQKDLDGFKKSLDFGDELATLMLRIANFGQIGEGNVQILNIQKGHNEELKKRILLQKELLEQQRDQLNAQQFEFPVDSKERQAIEESMDKISKKITDLIESEADASGKAVIIEEQINLARLQNQKEADQKAEAQREKALAKLKEQLERDEQLRFEHLKTLLTTGIDFTPTVDFVKNQNEIEKAIEESGKEFDELATRHLKNQKIAPHINIVPEADINMSKVLKGIDEMADPLKLEVNKLVDNTIKGIATELAVGLGEAFAAVATGQGIGDVFASIGAQIGTALQNLGKQMIALSPIIAALKAGIKTLNPAILLPAGIGLVAIGSLIKSSLGKLPGFAQGGVVPPGYPNDTFLARLTSGERIIPAGQQLAPAFARSGGGSKVIMHKVSGADLMLWIEQSTAQRGRYE